MILAKRPTGIINTEKLNRKNLSERKFTNLLKDNTPKTFTSKLFKSSSGYLHKNQETQEDILKRYNITEGSKTIGSGIIE